MYTLISISAYTSYAKCCIKFSKILTDTKFFIGIFRINLRKFEHITC